MVYYDKLDDSQITFIEKKVEELGSWEAVKRHYFKKCTVQRYAFRIAKKLYGEEK